MKNDKGETITSRKGIANVFAEFYSKFYAEDQLGEEVQDPHNSETKMNTERESRIDDVKNEIPESTQDEVQTAIDNLEKGEASEKQWNPCWRYQDVRRNDETNDKTDLQRSDKARGLHTRNMEKKTYKKWSTKKEM